MAAKRAYSATQSSLEAGGWSGGGSGLESSMTSVSTGGSAGGISVVVMEMMRWKEAGNCCWCPEGLSGY